ncbi:MAG: hypothetical protein KDA21_09870 [Phycisphaerales bacterium]|nr:hypothetical protein [Phycisphaerales bacterium]
MVSVAAVVLFGCLAFSPFLSRPSDEMGKASLISLPEGIGTSRLNGQADGPGRGPQYDLGLPSPELRFEVESRFGGSLDPVRR